ncbi:TfoX/Sxy family protein [Nocardia sp. CDC159]|uniref:TfoX/Sxy family protein n=1 Tax=Nocardia pulmonis TaxID=2951408 RepID=A0A9X2ECG3_9NOCA|nr:MULTISPECIES: TfoX/Sxy family protein [Nocardia]MCM6775663.1 TfoX/Sxy family protein [Nocardia pulmonis]MCM6788361.1 TfoX/Sxy family protein [Nocardia sp. CDC159]
MAYDEQLADRIRDALGPALPEAVEKKMFGGLSFLIDGNLAVAASGKGGLLVRVAPEEVDRLIDGEFVTVMTMGGREMRNWLRVAPEPLADDAVLGEWVERGVRYARSLPAK